MREPANIEALSGLAIDYMGFIFYEASARYAGEMSAENLSLVPSFIKKTGVFVNASGDAIRERIRQFRLDAVQLHGTESPRLCSELQSEGVEVIKAFSIAEASDLLLAKDYVSCVDYFLFDTKTPLYGGSGKQFDWTVLQEYSEGLPFFLSGGIGPEDALRIQAFSHPSFYALDLNSRFEQAPGLKDISLLRQFINEVKNN